MPEHVMLKPKERRSAAVLEELGRVIREDNPNAPIPVKVLHGGIIEPITRSKRQKSLDKDAAKAKKNDVKRRIDRAQLGSRFEADYAKIIAIIPTYEREAEIDKTVISLLMQTRQVDQIIVLINGPGESDVAYDAILPLMREFRDQVIVERPYELNGRFEDGLSMGSKVRALNWMYLRYIQLGDYDFVLGVDADVEADRDMVHHLETDLIHRVKAAGVMARYSFKIPAAKDMRGKSLSLIHGQRHEFAVTGIRQQLRGYRSEILGGQATLFRAKALREAAHATDGNVPWDSETLVEDAELTRTLQKLGYTNATSPKARAWTGLMYNAHSWQKQRRKWQDGHFADIIRDFNPWIDRRRWLNQIALGWNLALRILFFVVLITSVALDQFIVSPFWMLPIILAIFQSVLVASKIPNRSFRELARSVSFISGEIYYMRTLAVWLDSALLASVNIRRDGWGNQHKAESAQQRTALSSWALIVAAVAVPTVALFMMNRFLPAGVVPAIINDLWWTVTFLTLGSTISMFYFITRILRNYRTIEP